MKRFSTALVLSMVMPACGSSSSPAGTATIDSGGGAVDGSLEAGTGTQPPLDAAVAAEAGGDAPGSLSGHQARMILEIPADYTGTLSKLDLVYNATSNFVGPPTGTLYQGVPSGVQAGQPLVVTGDATGVQGDYYVVAILYMKGGGTYVPKPGTDYVGETPAPKTFSGGPVDLGTLPVVLAPADGGL